MPYLARRVAPGIEIGCRADDYLINLRMVGAPTGRIFLTVVGWNGCCDAQYPAQDDGALARRLFYPTLAADRAARMGHPEIFFGASRSLGKPRNYPDRHSVLSARTGSTDAARRAGMIPATNAATASVPTAAAITPASHPAT
jgi:hypothetical protein